ncbi:MAG: pyridoxal-phosphate dependent enzyme, partial [Planctomycetota bacterium]
MQICNSILELVGQTPMVKLNKIVKGIRSKILLKLEFFNPSGSVKDRIALHMIEEAERRGILKKGGVVVEPTSGNTGIGLAFVCAVKGYKMIAILPEAMSEERIQIIKALGAKVVTTRCEAGKGSGA